MSDEPAKLLFGDTAISAMEEHPGGKRGFFGRKRRQRKQLTHCENCDAVLTGKYCGQCGQPAIDYRRSFRHVIVDVLDSFLNWDSKFIATIGWLIVRPWRLTNEFLAGHRVRYLHPLRLYLLASILFFFAVNYGAKKIHIQPGKNLTPDLRSEIEADLQKSIHIQPGKGFSPDVRAEVAAALRKENLTPQQRSRAEKALNLANQAPDTAAVAKENITPKDSTEAGSKPEETPNNESSKDANSEGPALEFGNDPDNVPSNAVAAWLQDRAKEKFGEHGTNARLVFITLINNLPYMMLCCIPLFAFVLKILYVRKRIFYIDHLVYALHIHTFAYVGIMLIVASTMGLFRIAPPTLAGWIVGLLWFLFAIQVFLSIRRVYRQGWFFSLFKFFVGGFVYLIVLSVALGATFVITLALPSE
jgi:Protein of unknown function (DUF3667)